MDTIIKLSAKEARSLLDALRQTDKSGGGIRSLRVSIEGENVKFKVNEQTWSPPMGTLDPGCAAAERAALQAIRLKGEEAAADWKTALDAVSNAQVRE